MRFENSGVSFVPEWSVFGHVLPHWEFESLIVELGKQVDSRIVIPVRPTNLVMLETQCFASRMMCW